KRAFSIRIYDLSAQMSYYLLMSAIPFLLVIYSFLSFLPIKQNNILDTIEPFTPGQVYKLIQTALDNVVGNQHGKLFFISLIIALWLSTLAFMSLKRILNDTYHAKIKDNVIVSIAKGVLLSISFALAVSFSVFIPFLEKLLKNIL